MVQNFQIIFFFLGIKPKVRDHYHAHRLSFWLHLFPQLHATSSINVSPEHHLLDDHYNPQSYDGAVRQVPFSIPKSVDTDATMAPLITSTPWNGSGPKMNILLSTIQPNQETTTVSSTSSTTTINITDSLAISMPGFYEYPAMSVTVTVGISLLALNVLIFSGIYFMKDKKEREEEEAAQKRVYSVSHLF